MYTGGYKIIDLNGANFIKGDSGFNTVNVPGVYDSVENSYNKPIIISGMKISGVERPDRWVNFGLNGTTYVGNIGLDPNATGLNIEIDENDNVTLKEI